MKKFFCLLLIISVTAATSYGQPIRIDLAHGSKREKATKKILEHMINSHDLSKYTFTRKVLIEEGAINHATPILTLNVRFAKSADELLSSYIHEQIHWHLDEHDISRRQAIAVLRRMYPNAPIKLPEGAGTVFSTYGHLMTCYLEVKAIRSLLGSERATAVIKNKRQYHWIYSTVLSDEERIEKVLRDHKLDIE